MFIEECVSERIIVLSLINIVFFFVILIFFQIDKFSGSSINRVE